MTKQPPPPSSPWMNNEEAATYLGNSPKSLSQWRHRGHGPKYHVMSKRLIRYHVNDLDAFVRGEG